MQRQYKKKFFFLGGVMDVIAIATYLFYSLGNGRILFIPISFIHFLYLRISALKAVLRLCSRHCYATNSIIVLFILFCAMFLRQNYLVSLFFGDSGVYAFCYRKLLNLRNTVVT